MPILKPAGYILGEPMLVPESKALGVPVVESRYAQSRGNSRIVYNANTIVHEHPSRVSRSPSPIGKNPDVKVIPATNFIYNGGVVESSSRYSPAKNTIVSVPVPVRQNPPPPNVPVNLGTNVSVSTNAVPKKQYDLCVTECKNWEKRYDELYQQFINKK